MILAAGPIQTHSPPLPISAPVNNPRANTDFKKRPNPEKTANEF